MKKQPITKYEKRLIMTNTYYHTLIDHESTSRFMSYYALANRYLHKHLPSYPIDMLLDLIYDWTIRTFNDGTCYISNRNPSEVINKCKEYGINLEDIKNLQGYIN